MTAASPLAGLAGRLDRAGEAVADQLRGRPLVDRTMYAASELGDFSLCWHLLGAVRGLRSDADAAEAVRLSAVLGVESLLVNQGVKRLVRRTRPDYVGERPHRLRRPRRPRRGGCARAGGWWPPRWPPRSTAARCAGPR